MENSRLKYTKQGFDLVNQIKKAYNNENDLIERSLPSGRNLACLDDARIDVARLKDAEIYFDDEKVNLEKGYIARGNLSSNFYEGGGIVFKEIGKLMFLSDYKNRKTSGYERNGVFYNSKGNKDIRIFHKEKPLDELVTLPVIIKAKEAEFTFKANEIKKYAKITDGQTSNIGKYHDGLLSLEDATLVFYNNTLFMDKKDLSKRVKCDIESVIMSGMIGGAVLGGAGLIVGVILDKKQLISEPLLICGALAAAAAGFFVPAYLVKCSDINETYEKATDMEKKMFLNCKNLKESQKNDSIWTASEKNLYSFAFLGKVKQIGKPNNKQFLEKITAGETEK